MATDSPLRRALSLPFQPTSLLFVGSLALLLAFAQSGTSPVEAPGLAIVAYFSLSWLNKYAFALLDRAANGAREAPVASVEMLGPFGDSRAWVHPVLAALCALGAWKLPMPWSAGVVAAGVLLLPASLVTLAVSHEPLESVNPLALWRTQRALGAGGAVLSAALFGGAGIALLLPDLPLHVVPRTAAWCLLLLLFYCLVGAIMFERRTALGFEPEQSPERQAARAASAHAAQRQQSIDAMYAAVRVNEYARASATMERWLDGATGQELAGDVAAMLGEARNWGDARGYAALVRAAARHGVRAGHAPSALAAAAIGLRELPDFTVGDEGAALWLAQEARLAGQRRLAVAVLERHRERSDKVSPELEALLRELSSK